jgi:DNA-binding SARP family transcriptional activator
MYFNLLGPLEVVAGHGHATPGGFNQRATLAFLLLHHNTTVSTRHLVKALWPGNPPPTAKKMLQNAVAGLRRMLHSPTTTSSGPVLVTRAPGYLLRVEPGTIDLVRFHELTALGRTAMAQHDYLLAARHLRQSLSIWRGPTLADLEEQGVGWAELRVTDDAKLTAFEIYADAELAAGRPYEVVGDLEQLLATAPAAREALCAQLMLALYRCGRQAEALNAYRRARAALVGDLGIEPGRALQRLEQAILGHHPALLVPSTWAQTVEPVSAT